MRVRPWAGAVLAMVPLAALGAGPVPAGPSPPVDAAIEPGFLEFLAEEAGLDEELSEALMTDELDRDIERSATRRKEQGNVRNEG